MKAIQVKELGGPEKMELADVPKPSQPFLSSINIFRRRNNYFPTDKFIVRPVLGHCNLIFIGNF